jgi:hypothetical protein
MIFYLLLFLFAKIDKRNLNFRNNNLSSSNISKEKYEDDNIKS